MFEIGTVGLIPLNYYVDDNYFTIRAFIPFIAIINILQLSLLWMN